MHKVDLHLDGIDYSDFVGLGNLTLNIGLNNNGAYGITTSGQIESTTNQIFIETFIDGSKDSVIDGQLIVNEFDFILPVQVLPDAVEICECTAEFMLTTGQDDKGKCYKELSLRTITDIEFIQYLESTLKHRYLFYNLDFSGLLIQVANQVANILGVPGLVATALGKSDEVKCLLSGACRTHAVHKVNDMLEWMAQKCNRTIQSGILYDAAYKNAYMLATALANGEIITDEPAPTTYDAKNYSNTTIVEFLNEYVKLFNAEWRLQGDKIVIEHWTYFKNQAHEIDYYADELCFEIAEQCAALSLKYSDDSDISGNTSAPQYDERINFTQGGSYIKTMVCDVQARLGRLQGTLHLNQDKAKVNWFTNPAGPPSAFVSQFNAEISNGIASLPKVFNTQIDQDRFVLPQFRPIPGTDRYQFNYDFSFDQDDPNSLTNRWYYTAFPNSGQNECYYVPSLVLPLCEKYFTPIMNAFSDSITVYVNSPLGKVYFNRGRIDFDNNTITLQDGVIYG